jgi:hypothetical protein
MLLQANPIEVPGGSDPAEIERLMQVARQDMEQRGMKVKDLPMQPEWFADQARRRVSLGLILAEIVKLQRSAGEAGAGAGAGRGRAQSYDIRKRSSAGTMRSRERLAISKVRRSRPTWWTGCWPGEGASTSRSPLLN